MQFILKSGKHSDAAGKRYGPGDVVELSEHLAAHPAYVGRVVPVAAPEPKAAPVEQPAAPEPKGKTSKAKD